MKLPAVYRNLKAREKKEAREQYIKEQDGNCWYCKSDIYKEPPTWVTSKPINLRLFPPGMLKNPLQLQHDHKTGLTEGTVHAYCNCVLWQYEGR